MSEARHVTLASTSNAEDAGWLAVADVAAVATDLGIDDRLIGGNSVTLLGHVHDATTQAPDRATADADKGVSFEVCADPRLVPALTALGYDRKSGNRFIRTQGTHALAIDGPLAAAQATGVHFYVQEAVMKTMSYTESRARYAEVLDGVTNDREEVIITRAGHDPVVIVSLDDYESLRETAYLMRSPGNARRLLDAMERLEAGRGEAHDLIQTD